jgi:hypothetical protein
MKQGQEGENEILPPRGTEAARLSRHNLESDLQKLPLAAATDMRMACHADAAWLIES